MNCPAPALRWQDHSWRTAHQQQLTERIGEDGRRLHVARSRNDQVATDLRLYCKGFSIRLALAVLDLMDEIVNRASNETETLMPGFTHLQIAQPITLGHYLLALAEMHERDLTGILHAHSMADVCPLGSGALAGCLLYTSDAADE